MKYDTDFFEDLDNINRFEYIDETGRVVVCYLKENEKFVLTVQDGGTTMKVIKQTLDL